MFQPIDLLNDFTALYRVFIFLKNSNKRSNSFGINTLGPQITDLIESLMHSN